MISGKNMKFKRREIFMHIHTMDENYDYRMKRLVEKLYKIMKLKKEIRRNYKIKYGWNMQKALAEWY